MTDLLRIGVDLGGTKTEIMVLSRSGEVLLRRREATPRGDYAASVAQIGRMVRAAEAELGARGTVGIGTPGAVSALTGRMKNCNSVWLNGQPLAEDLARELDRPVRLSNDANCFALSEAVDGAGQGARVVFGVILGTGVGAGIVVDGRVLDGANRIAGEWGHNPLPLPGAADLPLPACYCGRAGCIERYLSGPAWSEACLREQGLALEPAEIAERAASGVCQASLASLDTYLDRLARALAGVINLLDPDVIVLGGGLSNIPALYEGVPARWGRYVFSDRVLTRLVAPAHGDSSGVRGAAWLWNEGAPAGADD
ncbi:MAG: ROK family protein [Paludibacterium sp.]|uniref:ROK family protein n=1 Tax=Paludibacterium sp. TaxID=1917523 RepID=UPI0025D811C1|nr:ROK family protein [Paludibacterium sp.]MBV8049093.1 ROK family protein [Paludibacterium sp.]MBV8648544.1 ROK family protein [Paludibacterium sp.]